jgi:hypothetical protein
MVKRFATLTGSLNKHTQVLDDLALSGKIVKAERTQSVIQLLVACHLLLPNIEFLHFSNGELRIEN